MRLQIGISEFVETVRENIAYIEENLDIFDQKSITAFIHKTKKIEKYLPVLDAKQTGETGMFLKQIFRYIKMLYVNNI